MGSLHFAEVFQLLNIEGNRADAGLQQHQIDLHVLDDFAGDKMAAFVLHFVRTALAQRQRRVFLESRAHFLLGDRPECGERLVAGGKPWNGNV